MTNTKPACQDKPSCQPCRCSPTFPKANVQKEIQKRPSSASHVKSSPNKKTSVSSSKAASSDTKIAVTNVKNKITTNKNKREIDSDCCKQLREDLKAIKEQLALISTQKKGNYNDNSKLESEYNDLKCKCQNQEEEIESLKSENNKLQEQLQNQSVGEGEEVVSSKLSLDEYGNKLSCLYNEFIETSKIMEESRSKICRCIKEKSNEYQEMVRSKNELFRAITHQGEKYARLMSSYEECKESERKHVEYNKKLMETVEMLEEQLNSTAVQLEASRKEKLLITDKYKAEFESQNKLYTCQLEAQNKKMEELNATITQLELQTCKSKCTKRNDLLQSKYDQLAFKYKRMVDKLNFHQQNNKNRRDEVEALKTQEKNLIEELVKLQNYCNNLKTISEEHNFCLVKLNSANNEKDAVIKRLQAQVACKDKQVSILRKDEDRLKRKVIELQEEVVTLRVALSSKNESNVLCAEDCPIHLTEELEDLIAALYEEIDKTHAKDEEIKRQQEEICRLQLSLQTKECELGRVRNNLQMSRNRYVTTSRRKREPADHFKKCVARFDSLESEDSSRGCRCDKT